MKRQEGASTEGTSTEGTSIYEPVSEHLAGTHRALAPDFLDPAGRMATELAEDIARDGIEFG